MINTHINGHTLFDNFGPLVSFVFSDQQKKKKNFEGDHPMKIPTKFGFNWPSGCRED